MLYASWRLGSDSIVRIMAPTFRIHKPDVLATLPQPLGHSKGRYHAGEVYVQQPGSKKRKRLEVAVGVDGEAANIYHVGQCLSPDLHASLRQRPCRTNGCLFHRSLLLT